MRLTRKDLDALAKDVRNWATRNKLGKDYGIFWNGKLFFYSLENEPTPDDPYHMVYHRRTVRNVNPSAYCEYFPERFTIGMMYDATMYECINGYSHAEAYDELLSILSRYGLYLEHADSCHCVFYPRDGVEVEHTIARRDRKVVISYWDSENAPACILDIIGKWRGLCDCEPDDDGSCVVGAYLGFTYMGVKYELVPPSPFQGSLSWERPLPQVKEMLKGIGAEDIYYYPGTLD